VTLPVAGDVAPGVVPPAQDSLEAILRMVLNRLSESDRKTLYSASISEGGLVVQGGGAISLKLDNGVQIFYAGPLVTSGGVEYQGIIIRRADGTRIFSTFPVSTDPNVIAWGLFDHAGREVVSSDAQTGGLARPWIPVHLVTRICMATGHFDYSNIAVSGTERTMWEGRIPFVSGPYIEIDGVWGQASGSNSNTYRLKVGGVEVGSWTVGGGLVLNRRGPYSLLSQLNAAWVPVELTVQSTGTGVVACEVLACSMRQT
jgi:hypothetical protein